MYEMERYNHAKFYYIKKIEHDETFQNFSALVNMSRNKWFSKFSSSHFLLYSCLGFKIRIVTLVLFSSTECFTVQTKTTNVVSNQCICKNNFQCFSQTQSSRRANFMTKCVAQFIGISEVWTIQLNSLKALLLNLGCKSTVLLMKIFQFIQVSLPLLISISRIWNVLKCT